MWFKNLQLYRLSGPWQVSTDAIEEQLQRFVFQRCGNQDMKSVGWLPPKDDVQLVHTLGQHRLLSLGTEQKILPASVINEIAAERAAEIEEIQGYRPGRKQMREIKEDVTDELLPRAFTKRQRTNVWIDPQNRWVGIDATNVAKADEVVSLLSKSFDDFPLSPLRPKISPSAAMAEWLTAQEAPSGFSIDRDCELKATDGEKPAVRYARHALEGDEIRAHLEAGKRPTRLALTWNDRLSFVLTEALDIKRIAPLDIDDTQAESADEQFDANFALMTGEFGRFLPDLIDALGGEEAVLG